MLAGMDQHRPAPIGLLEGVEQRRNLHEVGPRRRDQMNLGDHAALHAPSLTLPRNPPVKPGEGREGWGQSGGG